MSNLLEDAKNVYEADAKETERKNSAEYIKSKAIAQKLVSKFIKMSQQANEMGDDLADELIGMGVNADEATKVVVGILDNGGADKARALEILRKAGLKTTG